MSVEITPPWSIEQVDALNAWQRAGFVHPFTCGECSGDLLATPSGWICPNDSYRQQWAHSFMADPDLLARMVASQEGQE